MASVLFVAPSAYVLSGLATWLDYLLPGLAGLGWDARLGLVSGSHHHLPARYVDAHPAPRVAIAHCATGTAQGRADALDRMLGDVAPDIAVSVNIPDLFVAINRRRERRDPAPRAVMSVHGIESWLYADARRYRPMLDAVVCTNQLACLLTSDLSGIEPERILYAPYGVPAPDAIESLETREVPGAEAAPAADAGPLRVLYSGRLEGPQKRARELVPIVHGLRERGIDFRLEIAGDGPERGWLEAALADEIAAGKVRFLGMLDAAELEERCYAKAQALILTSLWETGPIVVWEAMAQGMSIVSSRYIGSGREAALVDGENALMFDIGDVDGAVDALARLSRESRLRAKLSAAGRTLVANRYSTAASVRAWDRCMSGILRRDPLAAMPTLAPAVSGRLDRWLGPSLAESIRRAMHRSGGPSAGPGSEWPHSHARVASDATFWKLASAADAREGRAIDVPEAGVVHAF